MLGYIAPIGMIVFGVAALSLLQFGDDSDKTRRTAVLMILGQAACLIISLITLLITWLGG